MNGRQDGGLPRSEDRVPRKTDRKARSVLVGRVFEPLRGSRAEREPVPRRTRGRASSGKEAVIMPGLLKQYGAPLDTGRYTTGPSRDAGAFRGTIANWNPSRLVNMDAQIRERLTTQRRAADLAANDWAAKSGIRTIADNAVGTGLVPKSTIPHKLLGISREEAAAVGEKMEWAFASWSRQAHARGIAHFEDLQYLGITSILRLGEMLHLPVMLPPDAGRISLTDSDAGGTPQVSPSNKRAFMDRAVTVDADGKESEVWLDLTANNYLNGQGIVTVNNFDGGWKFWGNRTACYPSVTDPKDAFIPIRRFFNWYQNTFILTYFQKVDAPLTRRLITTFLKSEQLRLDGLTAREVINGGRISFLESENPVTDLMDGLLRFHLWISPPPPARAIEGIFEFDPTYLQTLFGEE